MILYLSIEPVFSSEQLRNESDWAWAEKIDDELTDETVWCNCEWDEWDDYTCYCETDNAALERGKREYEKYLHELDEKLIKPLPGDEPYDALDRKIELALSGCWSQETNKRLRQRRLSTTSGRKSR